MARRLVYDWFHGLDNTLFGDDDVDGDEIRGGDGQDKLFGMGGDDLLLGGNGHDTMHGGQGNDILRGGQGRDYMIMDRGNNTFDGGSDDDTVQFLDVMTIETFGIASGYYIGESPVGFSVDLESGITLASTPGNAAFTDSYGTNSFTSIERYELTNNDDVFRGDNTADSILGMNGDDIIEGRGGADTVDGFNGSDTASYESSPEAIDVDLSRVSSEQFGGDAAGDRLFSIENLIGSHHADLLIGDKFDNRIDGGAGGDEITGGGGRDVLRGAGGADAFIFTKASDSFGNFDQRDIVLDFVRSDRSSGRAGTVDFIDVHAMDADLRPVGNQDFDFIGSNAFTGAHQIRVTQGQNVEGRNFSLVEGEINGDGRADFALTVFTTDNLLLNEGNFIL